MITCLKKTFRVLVKESTKHEGYMAGLTESKINVLFLSDDTTLIGQIVNMKINSAGNFSVEGELISH